MSVAEVIRNPVAGWDTRLLDEEDTRANFESRREAVAAAEQMVEVGEADQVVVHDERRSETVDTEAGIRPALIAFAVMTVAVIALIAVVSLVLSLTGFAA